MEFEDKLWRLNNTHSTKYERIDKDSAAILIQKVWRGYITRKRNRNRSRPLQKRLIQQYKPNYDITRIMMSIQQKSLASKEIIVSKEKLEQNRERARELLAKDVLSWMPFKELNLVQRIEFWERAIVEQRTEEKSELDTSATPEILLQHKKELLKAGGGWWKRLPELLDEDYDSWLPEFEQNVVDIQRYY
jgi:hypothetical protein